MVNLFVEDVFHSRRIHYFIPLRLADRGDAEYGATQANQKEMDDVRKKLDDSKTTLETVTANKTTLERLIIAGKLREPMPEESKKGTTMTKQTEIWTSTVSPVGLLSPQNWPLNILNDVSIGYVLFVAVKILLHKTAAYIVVLTVFRWKIRHHMARCILLQI